MDCSQTSMLNVTGIKAIKITIAVAFVDVKACSSATRICCSHGRKMLAVCTTKTMHGSCKTSYILRIIIPKPKWLIWNESTCVDLSKHIRSFPVAHMRFWRRVLTASTHMYTYENHPTGCRFRTDKSVRKLKRV